MMRNSIFDLENGGSTYTRENTVTGKQITGFFSCLARKRRAGRGGKATRRMQFEDLSRSIINEIGLVHPIMFDSHNLCKLASSSKLTKFFMSMLQGNLYELDTSSIIAKRKKPYIDLILD